MQYSIRDADNLKNIDRGIYILNTLALNRSHGENDFSQEFVAEVVSILEKKEKTQSKKITITANELLSIK
jgi:hypothetical protein